MSADDYVFSKNILSMLKKLEVQGMGKPIRARIGLRSGNVLHVEGLRHARLEGVGYENYEIVAYQHNGDTALYDEVRFMTSDVESVTRIGLSGITPERAAKLHASMATNMVETIMTVEHEATMERFRTLGAQCVDERPDWFTGIVKTQIEKFDETRMAASELDRDTLKALLSEDVDDREVTAAVMIILVVFCYDALEAMYVPYTDEKTWLDAAMERVHALLAAYGA